MKIDNFYFVVKSLNKSIDFYTEIFEKKPTNIIENRWADWENEKRINGNNGVLGLYTDNIEKAYDQCKKIGARILYDIEKIPNSVDNYMCFAIEDLDGNKIEISQYDK